MNPLKSISLLQFFVVCVTASFGVSMITLPRSVAEAAQEDMWLSVVAGGILFLFPVWTAMKLASFFPHDTCVEYHRILLGPVAGQAVNILLVLLVMMVPVVSVRTFAVAAKMYLFDVTPPQVITFTALLLLMYITQYGFLPVIRMQQLIVASSHMIFFVIIMVGLLAVDVRHYQPVLANGLAPVLKGAIPSWYAYTGPEFAISLLYPFVAGKKAAFRWGAAAVGVLIVLYTLITLIVQGILGPKESAYILSPTILAYRSVEIPDTFIERIDGYFLIFWIPVFIACMMNWIYFIAFAVERILKLEDGRPVVALLVPVLNYLVDLPPNFQTAAKLSQWTNFALILWGGGILPFLLGIAWWQEKRRRIC